MKEVTRALQNATMSTTAFYYLIKPLIPRSIQITIRRRFVRNKLSSCADVWPIHERAATLPGDWKGWPEGKRFALLITHDVETARGQERCYELAKLDTEMGFRSSFNFVPEGYKVSDGLRHDLVRQGFEVGVHGLNHNGNPYETRSKFTGCAGRIDTYLKQWRSCGMRTPCMYHNLDWIGELSIEYDSSTFDTDPFEPQPDGTGTIFPFWVGHGQCDGGYVELPYTLPQDFTLFILMKERTIDIWKKKLDWIVEKGGMALVITHPDYMKFGNKKPRVDEYPVEFYTEFLDYLKKRYDGTCWHVLPKDMARFWKERMQ